MKLQTYSFESALAQVNCHRNIKDISLGFRRCNIKTLQLHVNICETVQLLQDFFCAMEESWKKLKTSNVFSSFIVCSNRNRSALVRELLSYYSLFVGQLYEDKSLAVHS